MFVLPTVARGSNLQGAAAKVAEVGALLDYRSSDSDDDGGAKSGNESGAESDADQVRLETLSTNDVWIA